MNALSALVRPALENYDRFTWTVQGFGMIRTYLDKGKQWRLNIWDDRLRVDKVSDIHDHPWEIRKSYILAGMLKNIVYELSESRMPNYSFASIVTGEGGGIQSGIKPIYLLASRQEIYEPGDSYSVPLDVVHRTSYNRGTITLNDRGPASASHTARVFWPIGTKWVDAEPRPAADFEIRDAVEAALEQLK